VRRNKHVASRRTLVFSVVAAIGCALLSSSGTFGQAAEPSDIEDLRRDVRALRAQVQSLRSALVEMADLDRQRAAILSRALSATTPALEPTPPPPPALPAKPERKPEAAKPPALPPALPAAVPAARRKAAAAEGGAGPASGSVRGKVDVPSGEPVAYVYVENIMEPAMKGKKYVIQQIGKKFVPSWAVVQRGTAIEFPNMDNIYHNVFSLSSGNTFDLGLYNSSGEPKLHTFTEPGVVEIYCNIHPQMAASALVVPNRHFAKVKVDGTFEIPGVPRGKRKIVAWSPGSRLTSEWVELDGASAEVNLRLAPKTPGHTNKHGRQYGSYE
jgi:plastocyanin